MIILLAGEHHALDVIMNFQSGRIPSMKSIHMLYIKSIARHVMLSSVIQQKITALTRLKRSW
uniref:Uncharacterized protein n=1 Tax=Lotus japonicus TaxID=34305 RepID=I3T2M5_LOTJA|nr:unknown [Lotus japonicus]